MHNSADRDAGGVAGRAREARSRRLVLKIGSRILTEGSDQLSERRFALIAQEVAVAEDTEVVIVSSGAVAAGFRTLGFLTPPDRVRDRQAAAAVGQSRLMSLWSQVFGRVGRDVAQVLLTNDCLSDRRRYVAARGALSALLDRGIIPIVNENDTVSIDELVVGDNDNLAAMTAALVDADLLVLLTDVPGVFKGNPNDTSDAEPIAFARSVDELRPYCYRKTSVESKGGMVTKLEAAERAGSYGIPTVIASGSDPEARRSALRGEPVGTFIAASGKPLSARRHWMSVQRSLAGAVIVDDGAVRAIRGRSSLLPSGVIGVKGRFRRGDLVSIVDGQGTERARGLVRFDDREIDLIRGLHSSEVPSVLGREAGSVVMRPDRMLVLEEES